LKRNVAPLPEVNPTQRLNEQFQLEQIHPGPLMARHFMRPQQIPPERLANETGISLEQITEILQAKRAITPEIAESIERCFGWPAKVLLDWQRRCDEAVLQLGLEFLELAEPYVEAQRRAKFKKTCKMLKKDVARFKKLALGHLRSRTR
jgi:addiction module HigA family antidote